MNRNPFLQQETDQPFVQIRGLAVFIAGDDRRVIIDFQNKILIIRLFNIDTI